MEQSRTTIINRSRSFLQKHRSKVIWAVAILLFVGLMSFLYRPIIKNEQKTEPIAYDTETIYDDTVRMGVTNTRQEGADGAKSVNYEVTYRNNQESARRVISEKVIEKPQSMIIVVGTKIYYTCSNGTEYDNVDAKNDCDKRDSWEKARYQALENCRNDSGKSNCWYDAYPGTTLHWTYYTRTTNNYSIKSSRSGAICRDNWRSTATGRGACSHHGGVSFWLY